MEPIVVGLDGSDSSKEALRWAVGAASAHGVELLLVSVVPQGTDHEAVEEEMLRVWSTEAPGSGTVVRTEVVEGSAGPVLTGLAAGVGECLVVIGRGHGGWFPALHLGSASHYLVHHVDRPICVVPAGQADYNAAHVVLGLDGSDGSIAAAAWTQRLAAATGAKLTGVYAWEHSSTRMSNVAVGPDSQEDAEQACAGWADGLNATGVLAETKAVMGEPSEVLAAAVADAEAGLLVLGKRAERRRSGPRLGCVSPRLLHRGALPLGLVPPPRGLHARDPSGGAPPADVAR
ncbi:MAG: universal stress protein [Acidimicrobiales bacterium]